MEEGDAATPTAGVRVHTPTIPGFVAAPTADFAPSSTPLSPSPPLQPYLNVGATVTLSGDEDEDEEDEDEGSDSEAAHRHRYRNSEPSLYMQSALEKARAHQDGYDRLGGHFDVSAEDRRDIHVVSDMEGEEMFRVPPSQRCRTGENPSHESSVP